MKTYASIDRLAGFNDPPPPHTPPVDRLDRIVPITEACAAWNCSRSTVYRWVQNGTLPPLYRVSAGKVGFRACELNARVRSLPKANLSMPEKQNGSAGGSGAV
jgi:excisionase family DNA binding protein